MIEILLVDDSPADVRLTIEALEEAKIHDTIRAVYDGESALELLHRHGPSSPASEEGKERA